MLHGLCRAAVAVCVVIICIISPHFRVGERKGLGGGGVGALIHSSSAREGAPFCVEDASPGMCLNKCATLGCHDRKMDSMLNGWVKDCRGYQSCCYMQQGVLQG